MTASLVTSPRTYGAGMSCWTELRATDVAGAVSFYTELFGWTTRDVDVGRDESYTVMQVGGSATAGVSALSGDDAQSAGAHWRLYTAVTTRPASIDLSTRKPPAVPRERPGRWIASKPPGAVFAASRAERVSGEGETNAPAVIWMDLLEGSLREAALFCRAFLEEPDAPSDGEDATVVFANEEASEPTSGVTMLAGDASALPPWCVSFVVRDCEQTVRRALALGARLAAPAESLGGLGRAAALVDPQGATFVCWQPQDHAAVARSARAAVVASAPELAAAGRASLIASAMRGSRGGDA